MKLLKKAKDFRFTWKGNLVYAMGLGDPQGSTLAIRSFSSAFSPRAKAVSLIGDKKAIGYEQRDEGLIAKLPEVPKAPYALAIQLD